MRKAIQVFGNTISILLATITLYKCNSSDSTFNVTSSSSSLMITGSALSRLVSVTLETGEAAGATGEVAASNDLLAKSSLQKSRKLQQLIGQTGFKICRICLTKPLCV